jgi:hypothetical protein
MTYPFLRPTATHFRMLQEISLIRPGKRTRSQKRRVRDEYRGPADYIEAVNNRFNGSLRGVLLDPDTGIRNNNNAERTHILVDDVRSFTEGKDLWIAYHHQNSGGLTYQSATELIGGCFAYNFGKAAMIVGGNENVVRAFRTKLQNALNPERIINGFIAIR